MRRLSLEQVSRISVSVADIRGQTVVLLDVAGITELDAATHNANIYCLSQDGDVMWQVDAEPGMYERDSFVSVSREADGSLVARRFFGNTYAIDQGTGAARIIGWSK